MDEVLENGTSGAAVMSDIVNRTWLIEEVVAGGSDLTITANWYTADEFVNFDRAACYVSHHDGTNWIGDTPAAAVGANPWLISRSGISSLSPFSVASGGVLALPVELLTFRAYPRHEQVQLEWLTAIEINADYFEIQHATDRQGSLEKYIGHCYGWIFLFTVEGSYACGYLFASNSSGHKKQ